MTAGASAGCASCGAAAAALAPPWVAALYTLPAAPGYSVSELVP